MNTYIRIEHDLLQLKGETIYSLQAQFEEMKLVQINAIAVRICWENGLQIFIDTCVTLPQFAYKRHKLLLKRF